MFVERQPWMYRAGEHPRDDQEYLELLTRVVFAAGLGPRVVASRWEGMREVMGGFAADYLAALQQADVDRLLADTRMIRNRRKIEATVRNAEAFRALIAEHGSFDAYLDVHGITAGFDAVVADLSARFQHLGATSAVLFLFSAGWRDREEPAQAAGEAPEPAAVAPAPVLVASADAAPPVAAVAAGSRTRRRKT